MYLPRRMTAVARIRIFIAVAALLAVTGSALAQTPESAPRDNVRRIEKFAHAAAFLNLAQGTVRMVAILPADESTSLAMMDTIAAVVRANPSKRLRAYIILDGEIDSGTPLRAALIAGRAGDTRIVCFWDPNGTVARVWGPGDAGCVRIYDTAAKFGDPLPPPALEVRAAEGRLDGAALRASSSDLVQRVEAKMGRLAEGQEPR
ncbi:MAG TPA: hypothetical protein VFU38_08145 [Candidatus Krumholzibacteria bacterium]|nr:hypothetical protein [Candidatus Krumholzibacteria bacterium]